MKSRFVGLGLLALAAAPANALTYVQDVNADNRFGGYFNPFDTSLGTLTKVTVQATVSDLRGASATFFNPNFSGQFQINLSGAIGSSLTDLISYSGSSQATLSSAQNYISVTGTGSGLFEYSGDALALFLGTGPQFIGLTNGEYASVSYGLPSGFPGYMTAMSNPAGISITHRITYEYDDSLNVETPVPEPASWAMMIVGFGVVGHALRRSKRSRRLAQAA